MSRPNPKNNNKGQSMKIRPLRCLFLSSALLLSPFMQVQADTADKTIALSNNYAGNSWRQNTVSYTHLTLPTTERV